MILKCALSTCNLSTDFVAFHVTPATGQMPVSGTFLAYFYDELLFFRAREPHYSRWVMSVTLLTAGVGIDRGHPP